MVDSKNTVQLYCTLDSGSAVRLRKSRYVDSQLVDCNFDSDKYAGNKNSNLIGYGKISVQIILDGVVKENLILLVVADNTMKTSIQP